MLVSVVNNIYEFSGLKEEWNHLLENTSSVNPFLSHQWLQSWWEVYGYGELHIITCRDSDTKELLGILPLFRSRTGFLPRVTKLKFMGSEQVSSDFLDCLASKGWEDQVFIACFTALQSNTFQWDVVELQDMEEDSPFCSFLVGAKLTMTHTEWKCCPYVHLPDSWESMFKSLSKKMRKRLGNSRRSLERSGTVELDQITDLTTIDDALEDLMRLRIDRLKQKKLSTARMTYAYHQFHALVMKRMLCCDKLRLYFLRFNGERVAYAYFYSGLDRLFFYQTGFNRLWSRQSVGTVLISMVIEQAINMGYSKLEFLRGKEQYKYDWAVSERRLVDINLFRNTIAGTLYHAKNTATLKIKGYLSKIISSFFDLHR